VSGFARDPPVHAIRSAPRVSMPPLIGVGVVVVVVVVVEPDMLVPDGVRGGSGNCNVGEVVALGVEGTCMITPESDDSDM
jgi:hypothetical protein